MPPRRELNSNVWSAGTVSLTAALLALTVACSVNSPLSPPTGLSSEVPESTACDLLNDEQVSRTAGDLIGAGQPREVMGLPACLWATDGGQLQVIRGSAAVWAEELPAVVDQLSSFGIELTPQRRRALEAAAKLVEEGEIDAVRACEIFSITLQMQGMAPNSEFSIQFVPSRKDARYIVGQSCRGGTFTSITFASPSLDASNTELARMTRALSEAEGE